MNTRGEVFSLANTIERSQWLLLSVTLHIDREIHLHSQGTVNRFLPKNKLSPPEIDNIKHLQFAMNQVVLLLNVETFLLCHKR